MPMPDPTGDTGEDLGFFNERRLLALLTILAFIILAVVGWLAYTVMQLKQEREKAGDRAPVAASVRRIAINEPAAQLSADFGQ